MHKFAIGCIKYRYLVQINYIYIITKKTYIYIYIYRCRGCILCMHWSGDASITNIYEHETVQDLYTHILSTR